MLPPVVATFLWPQWCGVRTYFAYSFVYSRIVCDYRILLFIEYDICTLFGLGVEFFFLGYFCSGHNKTSVKMSKYTQEYTRHVMSK